MKYFNISQLQKSIEELKSLIVIQNAEFIDIDEAAEYLKLKKSYLYNLIYRKVIPSYKPNGKKVYFNKLELNEWIKSSKIKTIDEVEEELKQEGGN